MLDSIKIKQFRSYQDDSFEFSNGVNIIVGPNASGKSNLLEAILVGCKGGSYRAADVDLISFGMTWTRIDIGLKDGGNRTIKIANYNGKTSKSYMIDDKPFTRLTAGFSVPVVLFEPNNLLLLNGQPEGRRNYLDDLLEQLKPGYASTRKHYRRVLSQRNTLLKRKSPDLEQQIFVWNIRLSELGGAIVRERLELVNELQKELGNIYRNIAKADTVVEAQYYSKLPFENYETSLLRKLESTIDQDVVRGYTTSGPHRDDLILRFNNVPTSETASRGETRTALLAMKIFELGIIERIRDQKPVLLLDDVFSELDGKRRHALTDYLQKYQTFITTTDADLIVRDFVQAANIITI